MHTFQEFIDAKPAADHKTLYIQWRDAQYQEFLNKVHNGKQPPNTETYTQGASAPNIG